MRKYKMKEAAKILGVHRDTLRNWENTDIIPTASRNISNNYREYTLKDIYHIAKVLNLEAIYLNEPKIL